MEPTRLEVPSGRICDLRSDEICWAADYRQACLGFDQLDGLEWHQEPSLRSTSDDAITYHHDDIVDLKPRADISCLTNMDGGG